MLPVPPGLFRASTDQAVRPLISPHLLFSQSHSLELPQTTTPRFDGAEIETHTAALKARIAELEA